MATQDDIREPASRDGGARRPPRPDWEQALRDSEEYQRAITELTSDYAYRARVEPDGAVIVEWASEGFRLVTGYTVEEFEARGGWEAFIHPDDLPAAYERLRRLLATGRGDIAELRLLTKDGGVCWLHYSMRPVWDPAQGRVVRLYGAGQDITALKEAEQRLRALSRRLLEVQEQERRHLACELHDEIGQDLTALKLTLECGRQLDGEGLRAQLDTALRLVKDLSGRVRDLSLRLRPAMLDDLGLRPALLWLFERYTAQTRVRVAFEHGLPPGRFPPAVETAAYRIVQEALTNVARHAAAADAVVRLWADDAALGVQVEDHGVGFDPRRAAGPSGGLSGMQERATLLGGHLEIESIPGTGTRLTALLPLRDPREAGADGCHSAAGR